MASLPESHVSLSHGCDKMPDQNHNNNDNNNTQGRVGLGPQFEGTAHHSREVTLVEDQMAGPIVFTAKR